MADLSGRNQWGETWREEKERRLWETTPMACKRTQAGGVREVLIVGWGFGAGKWVNVAGLPAPELQELLG